jgi:formamidopyrimidine-DNA glycosylase
MPELPEVENIKNSLSIVTINKKIKQIIVREPKLKWLVPKDISNKLVNQKILSLSRKNKYLIFELSQGFLLMHFGMSGHLKLLSKYTEPTKHDHIDIILNNNLTLRYHDPRKFGGIQYFENDFTLNKLFAHLGPEPLTNEFCGAYLYEKCKNSKTSIKKIIMDNKVVCGVGNIYANESLFKSAILPSRKGYNISLKECINLARAIKFILKQAIKYGGTTLRDYKDPKGNNGEFQNKLLVYGRAGKICMKCKNNKILQTQIGQRSAFYCPFCQK